MKKYILSSLAIMSMTIDSVRASDQALISSLQQTVTQLATVKNRVFALLPTQGRLELARLKLILIQNKLQDALHPIDKTLKAKAISDKQYNDHTHPLLLAEVLKKKAIADKTINEIEFFPTMKFIDQAIIDKATQDTLLQADNMYLQVIIDKTNNDIVALQTSSIAQINAAIMDKATTDIALLSTITTAQMLQAIIDKADIDIATQQAQKKAEQEKAAAELAAQKLLQDRCLQAVTDKIDADQAILTEQNNALAWTSATKDKADTDDQIRSDNALAARWLSVIPDKATQDIQFVEQNKQVNFYGIAITDKATIDLKNFIADPLQRKRFNAIIDKANK
jgi:hypothetical protein